MPPSLKTAHLLKPHFFTKTDQKLVFSHQKNVTFFDETDEKSELVSQKRVSFRKRKWVSLKKVKYTGKKVSFQKMPLLNVHKVYPVSRKIVGNKFRPCWMAIKNETQILKFEKLWLWIKIVYLILYHIFSSFTKWNQKNSNFVR